MSDNTHVPDKLEGYMLQAVSYTHLDVYKRQAQDDVLTVGDPILGFTYIPKRNIVYMKTGDVIVR